MSKIGKQPIEIPQGVTVGTGPSALTFKGPKGELSVPVLPHVKISAAEGRLVFELIEDSKQARSNWGTLRALAMNAMKGVQVGYEKELEIEGVGFRATLEGKDLVLNIGYSHSVRVPAPAGVTFGVDKNTIKISGIDKYLVGQVAADVRALKKPEPYKGKGIRYKGEVIRRKAGKKVAGTA
jgi:large subunit ribosomal protein L6